MRYKYLCVCLISIFLLPSFSFSQSFLSTSGTEIVRENGDPFILKGMGLGGWMLQEGYMMKTAGFAGAQHQLREEIVALIGEADTQEFYDAWHANHVRKIDIDSLASWGFNSVRLPMHYNLFTLPIEDEPVPGENTWLTKGFEMTDSLIAWCAANNMYVVLDLHAAPGGQGMDQAISDYDEDKPSLWESPANQAKTVALWKRLAERYVDEKWVAGYDLINETNWNMTGNTPLRDLYYEITDSIRAVDTNHIIFIEGNWWANDFTGLTPPWDNNMVYSPHKYWSINDQASIQWVLNIRDTYNVPIYFGETGENSNVWFKDAIELFDEYNMGWAWWPNKKIDDIAGPLSVDRSADYQTLLDYWEGNGSQPSAAFVKATLMQLTEDIKLENCRYQPDVVDAMFRQVEVGGTKPYTNNTIPGLIYCTDFDMGSNGAAYQDGDVANYQVSTGNFTTWNQGWAYRNDGVDIELTMDNVNTNGYNVGWFNGGEWMKYTVDVANDAVYDVEIRVATIGTDSRLHLEVDGADITGLVAVPNTGDWQTWQTLNISNLVLSPDDSNISLHCDVTGFNVGSMNFTEVGPSTNLGTSFVAAKTLDENTIQLNLNKLLESPIPGSPSGMTVFVNGNSIPIISTTLNNSNTRIITIDVDYTFTSTDVIRISYNGSGNVMNATDGTTLNNFSMRVVQNNIFVVHPIPGKIEAEDYFFQSGIQLESTTDNGGGENIGFLDVGDYADYFINVGQAGTYRVDYRTAALSEMGAVKMQLIDAGGNATDLHTVTFPSTGGWQDWTTTSTEAVLPQGEHQLRVEITAPLFNINWFEFSFLTSSEELEFANLDIHPNPNAGLFNLSGELKESQNLTIQVYNLLGQPVWTKQMDQTTILEELIDLRNVPDGSYLLTIRLEDGSIRTEMIVKMK